MNHARRVLVCLFTCLALIGTTRAADIPRQDGPASLERSPADRERDAREHPQEVLAFAGFVKGAVIADLFGGGGYYSEILAGAVGPDGRVRLINNIPYHEYAKADSTQRFANGRLPGVSYEVVPETDMKLGSASLDGAVMVMAYHDLYVADPENGWPAVDAGQFLKQVVEALKPGGVFLLVDHAAREGSDAADAQTLHRIDEAFARRDLESHGLEFVKATDILRNPGDTRRQGVMNPEIRGRTDRFVHLYRKP